MNKHNLHHYLSFWFAIVLLIASLFSESNLQAMVLGIGSVGFIAITKIEMMIDNQIKMWEKLNFDVEDLSKRKVKKFGKPRGVPNHKTVPTENEWIVWGGGECPVEEGTIVDVKHRDGVEYINVRAFSFYAANWDHLGTIGDIVAYRLSKGD